MYRVWTHAPNITALRPGHAKLKRLLIRSTALNMSNAAGLLGAGHVPQTGQSSCTTTKHKGYKLFLMLGQTSAPARCHTLWHGHVHLVATAKYAVIYLRMVQNSGTLSIFWMDYVFIPVLLVIIEDMILSKSLSGHLIRPLMHGQANSISRLEKSLSKNNYKS